jgi:hypothetical protein
MMSTGLDKHLSKQLDGRNIHFGYISESAVTAPLGTAVRQSLMVGVCGRTKLLTSWHQGSRDERQEGSGYKAYLSRAYPQLGPLPNVSSSSQNSNATWGQVFNT